MPLDDVDLFIARSAPGIFAAVQQLHALVCETCTEISCPRMSAGNKYEYQWNDGLTTRACSAPQYIAQLFEWVTPQLPDIPGVVPGSNSALPELLPEFRRDASVIFRRLFRVYAHIYYNHFEEIRALGAEPFLQSSWHQFMNLVIGFELIPNRAELAPLQKLIDKQFPELKEKRHKEARRRSFECEPAPAAPSLSASSRAGSDRARPPTSSRQALFGSSSARDRRQRHDALAD